MDPSILKFILFVSGVFVRVQPVAQRTKILRLGPIFPNLIVYRFFVIGGRKVNLFSFLSTRIVQMLLIQDRSYSRGDPGD